MAVVCSICGKRVPKQYWAHHMLWEYLKARIRGKVCIPTRATQKIMRRVSET